MDREALVNILTEPKNAITKQYKKLFEVDGVILDFERGALECIADMAVERGLGARGLRSILEELMKDLMYNIPSMPNVELLLITQDFINKKTDPVIVMSEQPKKIEPKDKAKRSSAS